MNLYEELKWRGILYDATEGADLSKSLDLES